MSLFWALQDFSSWQVFHSLQVTEKFTQQARMYSVYNYVFTSACLGKEPKAL